MEGLFIKLSSITIVDLYNLHYIENKENSALVVMN